MLEEQTLLTGTPEEKVIQCLKKAGWYEGRKTDISEVESYYSGKGITLTEPQKDIFREFYGLAEWWIFDWDEDLDDVGPNFEFYLMPGNYPGFYYPKFLDDPKENFHKDLKNLKKTAGRGVIHIGHIGYYYPPWCYADHAGRLWTISSVSGHIKSYDNMISLVTDTGAFNFHDWHSVKMKQYLEVIFP